MFPQIPQAPRVPSIPQAPLRSSPPVLSGLPSVNARALDLSPDRIQRTQQILRRTPMTPMTPNQSSASDLAQTPSGQRRASTTRLSPVTATEILLEDMDISKECVLSSPLRPRNAQSSAGLVAKQFLSPIKAVRPSNTAQTGASQASSSTPVPFSLVPILHESLSAPDNDRVDSPLETQYSSSSSSGEECGEWNE